MPRNAAVEAGRRRLLAEFTKEELIEEAKKYEVEEEEKVPVLYPALGEDRTGLQRLIEASEGMRLEEVLAKYGTLELARKYGLHKSTPTRWKERLGWKMGESGKLVPGGTT